MSLLWLSSSFGYYLILTLVNTFDKVYVTAFTSSASEITAYIVSGLFYERVGVKFSLILSFAISTVGGILILTWGLEHQSSTLFFIFFLLAKFGITCTLNIEFMANQFFFPTLFAATALGICGFLSAIFSALSYIVGELQEPIPMWIFTVMCVLSTVAAKFLKTEKND